MKELKIEQSSLTMPTENNKPENQHIAQEIKLLQFPHGNQTLLQNNQGMHKDAVTLNPDQLLELVRKSHYALEPLRDAYVQEATDHIARGNAMLFERLNGTNNEELRTYLQAYIDRNQATVKKAKAAFYTPQHELFMALCSGIPAAITLLFAREDVSTDEKLLEAFIALDQPVDISHMLSVAGLNGFKPGCGQTRSRMQMCADQSQVPEAFRESFDSKE